MWLDAAGTPHRTVTEPARIVSLVPSITELLFDLALDEQVVGRTTFCIHPAEPLEAVAKVGGTKTLRLDRLKASAPSHVIVNVDENRLEDVEAMRGFVPNVVVTHPIEPTDNIGLCQLIGGIFDRDTNAARLSHALERELALTAQDADSLPPKRVLYLIWREPWMTISKPTYISRMLALVNWETLGSDPETRYPEVDWGDLGLADADLVLLSSEPFPFKEKHRPEVSRQLAGSAEGPTLTQPRNRAKICLIDGEYISWYGSRAIAGLRYLRHLAREAAADDA